MSMPHETPTHRTEGWVFDATDGICPQCVIEERDDLRTRLAAAEEQAASLRHDLEHCRDVRSHLGVSMSDPVVMVDVDVFDKMVADLAAAREVIRDQAKGLCHRCDELAAARRALEEIRGKAVFHSSVLAADIVAICDALLAPERPRGGQG